MEAGTSQKVPPVIGLVGPKTNGRSRFVAFSGIAFVVVVSLTLVASAAKKKQNKVVLAPVEALFALKFPQQRTQAQSLCTEQGYKLLPQFVGDSGKLWLTVFRIGDIKANPGLCDVELRLDTAEGESRFYIRLMNENGWKFHDVYIAKLKDKEVNQLASYIVEHPFLSYAEVNSDKIVKGVKETADVLNDIQRIGNSLDQIFDSQRKTTDTASADVHTAESGSE